MVLAGTLERLLERRRLAEHGGEEGLDLRDQLARWHVRAEGLHEHRRLDERIVGDARHRRVPAATVHGQPEGSAHLLRGRDEVERLPTEDDALAAALVEGV